MPDHYVADADVSGVRQIAGIDIRPAMTGKLNDDGSMDVMPVLSLRIDHCDNHQGDLQSSDFVYNVTDFQTLALLCAKLTTFAWEAHLKVIEYYAGLDKD